MGPAQTIVLDRSGSMAVPTADGRTKMDLANLGTCAAIQTLGPFDEIGVIAVDSSPHVISSLVSASDKDRICGEVRRIQSMGGGIFTYTALVDSKGSERVLYGSSVRATQVLHDLRVLMRTSA